MSARDPFLRPSSARLAPSRSGRALLVLSAAALLFAWSGGGAVFTVAAASGAGVLAAAALSTWFHASAVRIDAPPPATTFAGDRFPLAVSLTNRARWFAAEDVTLRALGASREPAGDERGEPGAPRGGIVAALRRAGRRWLRGERGGDLARIGAFADRVPPGATASLHVVHPALRRGGHRQGDLEVASSFPLGLFVCRLRFALPHDVLVLPRLGRVRRVSRADGPSRAEVVHGRSGRGDELEVDGLRPWRPGESLRPVHWKLSARRGRLVAREFRAEPRPVVHVVLWTAVDLPDRAARRAFEEAVSLAATLVEHHARREHPVRLSVAGETTRTLRCRRGRAGATEALRALAEVAPTARVPGGAPPAQPAPVAGERRFFVCAGVRGVHVVRPPRTASLEVLDVTDPAVGEVYDRTRRRADDAVLGVRR